MKKYVIEFIGTFFLVLAVCMSGKAGDMAPVAIGSTLMVMIYAGGYISGAHYNPGVSLAAFIRGKLSGVDLIIYWIVQIAGGVVAALLASKFFLIEVMASSPASNHQALGAEMIGSFAIAFVVLNVATSKKTAGNSNYGLAIGFTVVAMAYILGPVSGGAFNSAVAFGSWVLGAFATKTIWLYFVGNIVGGAVAGLIYNFLKPDED